MKDILTFVTPVILSLISFFGAVYKHKIDLRKVQQEANNEIDRIEAEMISKAKLYENNVTVDMIKDVLDSVVKSLPNTKRAIDMQLSKGLKDGEFSLIEYLKESQSKKTK